MRKITVLLVDDHASFRGGIRAALESEEDIEVIGEAGTGRLGVQLAKKLLPDVVLMDIAMPLLNGLEATRQITRDAPTIKVLILSAYSDDEYVQQLIEAGAAGYLIKQCTIADIVNGIREAAKGNFFFSPVIGKLLRDHCREAFVRGEPVKRIENDQLTSREKEILQLVAEGQANRNIAAELCISVHTVKKHRAKAMRKLGIHDVAGLTRYAIAKGIIESTAKVR